MDNHARRLVHDDQVRIFVKDIKRDRLGRRIDLGRLLDGDGDGVPLSQLGAGVGDDRAVYRYRAVRDQPRESRPAQALGLWNVAAQCLIKARRRIRADPELN